MADVLTRLTHKRELEKSPPKTVRFHGHDNLHHAARPRSTEDPYASLNLQIPDFEFLTNSPNLLSPTPNLSNTNAAAASPLGSPRIPIHLVQKKPTPPRVAPWAVSDRPIAYEPPTPSINDLNEDWNFSSYHLDYKHTPPIVKGPCCVCGEGIVGAMVTALDKMWHPQHFTCNNCHVELIGPNYLEHDAKPYCKACHHSLFLPPCAGCGKELYGQYVKVKLDDEKLFHPECFTCTACKCILSPDNFITKDFRPYCPNCYHNKFSPRCAKCKEPIRDAKNKIFARGKQYHTHCFKCCECAIALDPNDFKEKDGNLYCTKDYNNLFKPKCAKCFTPILEKPTVAMGNNYHPACFNCTECKKQLSPSNFIEKNSMPFCPDCYHQKYSPKCAGCKMPIREQKNMVNAMGRTYHPDCFKCIECHKILTPTTYYEKNGLGPYCIDDYNKLFPQCCGCHKPIMDTSDMITVKGKPYHKDHFCCDECHRPLNPGEYFERDGRKYCPDDYHRLFSPKCAKCGQPIKDKMVVAQNQNYHPQCFKCAHCLRPLNPDKETVFEKEGRIYCEEDYTKLFLPKCAACSQPIKSRFIYALGQHYHPEHFVCAHCGIQLQENAFYEKDGKVYCIKDFMDLFAPKCKACRQPIMEDYCVFALGGDWHPKCFKCKDCSRLLEHENFYEYQGDPYCEEHYHARVCPQCMKLRRAEYQFMRSSEKSIIKPALSTLTLTDERIMDKAVFTNSTESRPVSRQSEFATIEHYDMKKDEEMMKRNYPQSHSHNHGQIQFHVHENEDMGTLREKSEQFFGNREHEWKGKALMERNFNASNSSSSSTNNNRAIAISRNLNSPVPHSHGGGGKNSNEARHEHYEEFVDSKLHPEKFPQLDKNTHFQQFVKKDEYHSFAHGY